MSEDNKIDLQHQLATLATQVRELQDREAIRDCLMRSAIGADRVDRDTWLSAFWPEAVEAHGWYTGNAHAFIEQTLPTLATWDTTVHMLGNLFIRLDSDGVGARVESYYLAYCRLPGEDGQPKDLFGGGRYLDRLQKRGSEWRIIERAVQSDWARDTPDSADWSAPTINGFVWPRGGKFPHDPLYALFGAATHQTLPGGK